MFIPLPGLAPAASARQRIWLGVGVARCDTGRFGGGVMSRQRAHEKNLLDTRQEQTLALRKAVRTLIRDFKKSQKQVDRRRDERFPFVEQVSATTERGERYLLLTRDISMRGIRLVATRSFLGQKLNIEITTPSGDRRGFMVRVLWSCSVGDHLYENGCIFLDTSPGLAPPSENESVSSDDVP